MSTKKTNKEVFAWGLALVIGTLTFLMQQYTSAEEKTAQEKISVTNQKQPGGFPLIDVSEDYSDNSIILDNSFKP